jgi:hypothetical protein
LGYKCIFIKFTLFSIKEINRYLRGLMSNIFNISLLSNSHNKQVIHIRVRELVRVFKLYTKLYTLSTGKKKILKILC